MNRSFGPAKMFWIYAGICVAGFIFIKAQLHSCPKQRAGLTKKSNAHGQEADDYRSPLSGAGDSTVRDSAHQSFTFFDFDWVFRIAANVRHRQR